MRGLLQDLRYGVRQLLRSPGFTAVAVFCLALGIGGTSTMFSLIDGVWLRPLPVKEPDQLVRIFTSSPNNPWGNCSHPDYVDFRDKNHVFSGVIACSPKGFVFSNNGTPEMIIGNITSGNYFSVLGVAPVLGRMFLPDEGETLAAALMVVVSHGFWQRRLGGDPKAVGREIQLNDKNVTIVGVAPKKFRGTEPFLNPEVWVPAKIWSTVLVPGADETVRRDIRDFRLFARVRPGISTNQVAAEMETLSRQLAQAYPETNKDLRSVVIPESKYRTRAIPIAAILMSIAGCVLLLSCANVANLLMARAESRRIEIAVREALGASRTRLVQQLLTESLLLSFLGTAIALLLAYWLIDLLPSLLPPNPIPLSFDLRVDGRVLAFTLVLTLLTGLIFGLVPAIRAYKTDLVSVIKGQAPRVWRQRFSVRSLLVVGQVAVSLVLLIGAGLLVRTLLKIQQIDTGFEKKNMLLVALCPGLRGYNNSQALVLYQTLTERLQVIPEVKHASMAKRVPLSDAGAGMALDIGIPGYELPADQQGLHIKFNAVGLRFFETMGTRILRGRGFDEHDTKLSRKIALINETMARRYWANENPVGRLFRTRGPRGDEYEIIGVVQDGKYNKFKESPEPYIYLSFAQNPSAGDATVIVETASDPRRLVGAVRRELQALDKTLPTLSVMTLKDMLQFSLYQERVSAQLVAILGLIGLILAAVGLYGVVSYTVNQQTHEIGIRMALGAQQTDVLKEVLRQGLFLALVGITIGLAGASAVMQVLSSVLYGVSATDPATFASVVLLIITVALAASYLPARRATKVDPMVALRYEQRVGDQVRVSVKSDQPPGASCQGYQLADG